FSEPSEIMDVIEKTIENSLFGSLSMPRMTLGENKEIPRENLPLLFQTLDSDTKYQNNERDFVVKDLTNDSMVYTKEDILDHNSYLVSEENDDTKDDNFAETVKEENTIINNSIFKKAKPVGVIFGTYIIVEIAEENKVLLIDQHAAHERVLYEKYLE